jgi:hypothetical protein
MIGKTISHCRILEKLDGGRRVTGKQTGQVDITSSRKPSSELGSDAMYRSLSNLFPIAEIGRRRAKSSKGRRLALGYAIRDILGSA